MLQQQPGSQVWLSGQGMVPASPPSPQLVVGAHLKDVAVLAEKVEELNLPWRHLHSPVEEDGWESAG